MLKLFCSYDSVGILLLKIWTEWVINCTILCHFSSPNHVKYHCRSQSCWSRSRIVLRLWLQHQKMRLLAAPAPQHWLADLQFASLKSTTMLAFPIQFKTFYLSLFSIAKYYNTFITLFLMFTASGSRPSSDIFRNLYCSLQPPSHVFYWNNRCYLLFLCPQNHFRPSNEEQNSLLLIYLYGPLQKEPLSSLLVELIWDLVPREFFTLQQ
jgi:hypothetical protein